MKIKSYPKRFRTMPEGSPTFEMVFATAADFEIYLKSVASPYYSETLQAAIKDPSLADWLYNMFMGRYAETFLRYEQTLWMRKFFAVLSNNIVSLLVNNMWMNVLPTEPLTADMIGETIVSSSTGDTTVGTTSNSTTSGASSGNSHTQDAGTTDSAVSNGTRIYQTPTFDPVNEFITGKQYNHNNVQMDTTTSGNASDEHSNTTDMTSNRVINGSQTKTSFVENIMKLEGSDLTMKVDRFMDHFAHLFLKVTGTYETIPADVWHLN